MRLTFFYLSDPTILFIFSFFHRSHNQTSFFFTEIPQLNLAHITNIIKIYPLQFQKIDLEAPFHKLHFTIISDNIDDASSEVMGLKIEREREIGLASN